MKMEEYNLNKSIYIMKKYLKKSIENGQDGELPKDPSDPLTRIVNGFPFQSRQSPGFSKIEPSPNPGGGKKGKDTDTSNDANIGNDQIYF